METVAQSEDKNLAEELLRFFVEGGEKECFAAHLFTCYDLIKPDVALEVPLVPPPSPNPPPHTSGAPTPCRWPGCTPLYTFGAHSYALNPPLRRPPASAAAEPGLLHDTDAGGRETPPPSGSVAAWPRGL